MAGRKVALVFALAAGVTAIAAMFLVSGGSAQGRSGDADCDGLTTTVDAAHVLIYGAGLQELGCMEAADINADGRVNSKDAALILQITSGLWIKTGPDDDCNAQPCPTVTPTRTGTPTPTPTSCSGNCPTSTPLPMTATPRATSTPCPDGCPSPTPRPTRTLEPASLGAEFSIGIDLDGDGLEDCSSRSGGDPFCPVQPPQALKIFVHLDELPDAMASYGGYDVLLRFTEGISYPWEPVSHMWPDCAFDVWTGLIDGVAFACAMGVPPAEPSTYTGVIGTVDITVPVPGCLGPDPAISLVHGDGNTDVVDLDFEIWAEAQSGLETLSVVCVYK